VDAKTINYHHPINKGDKKYARELARGRPPNKGPITTTKKKTTTRCNRKKEACLFGPWSAPGQEDERMHLVEVKDPPRLRAFILRLAPSALCSHSSVHVP